MSDEVRAGGADEARAALRELQGRQGWTKAEVARRVGMSSAAVSSWLAGTYRGNNARIEQLVRRLIETERDLSDLRAAGLDRHADLAVTEHVARVAAHAHVNADLAVVCGAGGGGKTWALKRYCAEHTGAWLVTMSPAVTTPAAVLARIADVLDGSTAETTAARLERAVVDRLSIGNALLVVDEAHHLTQALLDVVRCVYDAAATCGLVLAGNEPLWSRLASGDRRGPARLPGGAALPPPAPPGRRHPGALRGAARAAGGGPRAGRGVGRRTRPRRAAGRPEAARAGADPRARRRGPGPGRRPGRGRCRGAAGAMSRSSWTARDDYEGALWRMRLALGLLHDAPPEAVADAVEAVVKGEGRGGLSAGDGLWGWGVRRRRRGGLNGRENATKTEQ